MLVNGSAYSTVVTLEFEATQRDLSDLIQVDHSMVARWARGKLFPRGKTIQKLADALEITVDDLLTEGGGAGVSRIQDPELV